MRKKSFYTVPSNKTVDTHPAVFNSDYYFADKEETEAIPTEGVVDVSCNNPDCKTSFRTQKENAGELFETVKRKGCPVCGKNEFVLYKVKSL